MSYIALHNISCIIIILYSLIIILQLDILISHCVWSNQQNNKISINENALKASFKSKKLILV